MADLTVSDLVFPDQASRNLSQILGELKRSNLSIGNRLRSVQEDARFVSEAAAAFRRPLVANERCGSWYVPPEAKAASAYFKSTDGHAGQWRFSTRRLNLHMLPLIAENDGCIIVDSTRRGKRIPDALSKTVPMWCCVLNRVLFPELPPRQHELYRPPHAVSASEHSQMLARLPESVASFERLGLDLSALRRQLRKPLRPIWVNQPEEGPAAPGSGLPVPPDSDDEDDSGSDDDDGDGGVGAAIRRTKQPPTTVFEDFHPVVCCTSSRRVAVGGSEMSHSGYIQGAGDDTENWAHGLTPPVFWSHSDRLLSEPEAGLPDLIRSLVSEAEARRRAAAGGIIPKKLMMDGVLSVCALPASGPFVPDDEPGLLVVALMPQVTKPETWRKSRTVMEVGIGRGKIASRNLRQALSRICDFVLQRHLLPAGQDVEEDEGLKVKKVLVECETGKDISVGVVLALACRCFDDEGNVIAPGGNDDDAGRLNSITKDAIRVKLGRIMTAMPEANPSRATLQSVNSFLMDWGG